MRSAPWEGNIAWAYFAGVVCALYAVLVLYGYTWQYKWPSDWLALAVGFVSSIATLAAVRGVYRQIEQQTDQKEQDRIAINLADRAALSQPLSNVLGVQAKIAYLLKPLLSEVDGNSNQDLIEFPEITRGDLELLVHTIRSATSRPRDDISQLVAMLQIQRARLEGKGPSWAMTGTTMPIQYVEAVTYTIDSLLIFGRAQRLLFYARLEEENYENMTLLQSFEKALYMHGYDSMGGFFGKQLECCKLRNDKLWGLVN